MAPGRLLDSEEGNRSDDHQNGDGTYEVEVPVLIVGGGPSGLLQGHLLSRLGVKSLIVERYPERLGAPKAHALSPRSLEICRQAGLDVQRLRQLGTPRKDAYWVNFVTNLSGKQIGVLPYERMDTDVLNDTPEMIHNIPQPDFEQFVTEELSSDPNVEIRKGVSFCSLEHVKGKNADSDVITTVEERATGREYRIKSRHVIACDGAKSRVRDFLGIECEGEDSYETMMTIHFNADIRPVVGDRVGMLHWLADPAAAGFIIGYDLSNNLVMICNFDSKKHPVESWNEAHCRTVLNTALGNTNTPFDVLSFRPWILSRKIARTYRSNSVFLAGDAAHSFPPTGGLGLNSGLADVHNLAWRVALAHQLPTISPSFLDGYEADRRHVAEINGKQSVKNGHKIFGLLKSLGQADASMEIDAARTALYETLADPARKDEINANIEAQREHFDNLELHIGYVYGSKEIPKHASFYTPKYVRGARLPHVWVKPLGTEVVQKVLPEKEVYLGYVEEMAQDEREQKRFSSLDLCAAGAFTFVVGDERWEGVVKDLQTKCPDLKINIVCLGKDFEVVDSAQSKSWIEALRLKEGGGALIRPDQHIVMELSGQTSVEDIWTTLRSDLCV